ncbi:MAG: nicotinate-nucleotide adenylyltransferase [Bacillota bacterium]|nr:nicotinate-nucleotide adenylyltransferase [Bacillota bacterium]
MDDNVGILGGSFNPIHIGHIVMCQYVYEELNLNKIYLMPNENPPHKKNKKMLDGFSRLKMCEIVASKNDFLDIIDYEIGNQKTNFTIDTINYLTENKFNNKNIFFIVGSDSLMQINTWKNYEKLLKSINIVCIMRSETNNLDVIKKIDEINNKFQKKIIIVKMPLIQISSTDIRNRIDMGKSIKDMVDRDVLKYIDKMNLYK